MRILSLCIVLLLVGSIAYAEQVRGSVVNRDGAAQPACQVRFLGPADYSVWTNSEGAFFLEDPQHGKYEVTVKLGDQSQTFEVAIDQYGLSPSTLVVSW
jgi:hypothetical protein